MNTLNVHPLFGDHAVLQRDRRLPIWGTAQPGAVVEVSIAGRKAVASADADGRWMAYLDPLRAGGPHELVVKAGGGNSVAVTDILVGDVFLCSGQSNMEWVLRDSEGGAEAAAGAQDPMMRVMTVPRRPSADSTRDLDAKWLPCDATTSPSFSAVAFYGGRALRRASPQVPVGMIAAAWGGTRIEPWISPAGLQAFPRLYEGLKASIDAARLARRDPAAFEQRLRAIRAPFEAAFNRWHAETCGADGGEAAGFTSFEYDIGTWPERTVPGYWPDEVIGNHEGIVWFACDVDVPQSWGRDGAVLHLGEIDNEDTTWLNGVRVGSITALDGMEHWCMQRDYEVPAGVLRPGRNRLVVRVIDYGGRGGFGGGPHGMCIQSKSGEKVMLPGKWRFRIGSRSVGARVPYPAGWSGGVDQGCPGALFGGMIAPLVPAAIAGVWWYQGESNVGEALAYRDLMKALVLDWRRLFQTDPDSDPLPFFWIQLTGFTQPVTEPGFSGWALLREAQTLALSLPGTGQAVIIDCGDAMDVHPKNKRDPGERLAALVRSARGDKVAVAGPRFADLSIEGTTLRVRFACAGKLKTTDGKPPAHVAICGADRTWRWAETRIEANAVVARNPDIKAPVAVRYAWADNPASANLTDETGLPAWPFRTDDWPEA